MQTLSEYTESYKISEDFAYSLILAYIEESYGIDFEDWADDSTDGPEEIYIDFAEILNESKARAPKLKGKALKARKNKSKLMVKLMSNPEIQQAVAKLRTILMRVARKEASGMGLSSRHITKALSGKVRI